MFDSIFGNLFDFNHNGEIDAFERAAELAFLNEMTKENEKDSSDDFDDSDN